VRDARAKGRALGSAWRNCRLARRGTVIVDPFLFRIAPFVFAAILLHAMAFILWNIGTRPPAQLIRDIGKFAWRGLWHFVLGFVILIAGAALMLSVTLVDVQHEFAVLELIAVVSGLLVETLLGSTIRAHLYSR
jgi:hypothetical protein